MLAVFAVHHHHHPVHHDPGCRTLRCDRHINKWLARRERDAQPPAAVAVASWYEDAGSTACGTHYADGVANKTLPCGTRVRLCHDGCEVAVVEDRGPFIPGREFDLNPGAKAAISCTDLCDVRWSIMR